VLRAPPQAPDKEYVDLVVLLEQDVSPQKLCAKAASKILASKSGVNMHLFQSLTKLPTEEAAGFASQVQSLKGVISAELLKPAGIPEIDACGEPTAVGAQQCTVSFADGTPTDDEFYGQDALEIVDFDTVQGWFKNEHQPVLVAVIDTGIDHAHPMLAGHVAATGWDFITDRPDAVDMADGVDNDKDGWIDEAYGHGTFLSSVILLMNPDARILPLRVLDADGNGNSYDVADAIYYAADHGAHVINLSLSMNQTSMAVAVAMEYARVKGASIFAAAGNTSSEEVLFPASYDARMFKMVFPGMPDGFEPSDDTVTAVASIDSDDVKADFSAWGPEVDVVTPGVGIYGAMPGGGYAWWSGTSMSTAVASGAASLTISVVGADQLKYPPQVLLKFTAQEVDDENEPYAGGLGDGRVNAWYAAHKAESSSNNGP
jgi:subtilisin family serine protease